MRAATRERMIRRNISFRRAKTSSASQHLLQTVHRQPQRSFRLEQVGPEIADVFYALGHVADGESFRQYLAAFYFLPGAGRGDGRPSSCTNSVSSGERGAVVVATGVDENAAAAIHFVKLAREIFRITRYQ